MDKRQRADLSSGFLSACNQGMDFVIFNPVPLGCTAAVGRLQRVMAAVTKSWFAVMVSLFVSRGHSGIIIIFFRGFK